jgi:hypothetical protein
LAALGASGETDVAGADRVSSIDAAGRLSDVKDDGDSSCGGGVVVVTAVAASGGVVEDDPERVRGRGRESG